MTADHAVVARGLTRAHGARAVLRGVSLKIRTGDRIAVVGPNGIGKSTLLQVLAGREPPDEGAVTTTPGLRVALMEQDDGLPDEATTVRDQLGRTAEAAAAAARVERLACALGDDPSAGEAYAQAVERYVALLDETSAARLEEAARRARIDRQLERPLRRLSGGERARVRLARLLMTRCDLLLLDEPTNDLDFDGLDLLERVVHETPAAVVVVSHDRVFLERTVSRILELEAETGRPVEYSGSYRDYEHARADARARASSAYHRWSTERARFVALLGERKTQARAAGHQASRRTTSAVASKVRAAERRIRDLDAEQVEKPWEAWKLQMELRADGNAGIAVELSGAVVDRGGFVLGPLDLAIGARERISLTGPNGSGKSTLVDALLGRAPLARGTRRVSPTVHVRTLDQRRSTFAGDAPLLAAFRTLSGLPEAEARTLLGHFHLLGDDVKRRAGALSPGERTRAGLALLQAQRCSLLILDEPTNHLDVEGIEQLELALREFAGGVLLATHDRRMLERFGAERELVLRAGRLSAA